MKQPEECKFFVLRELGITGFFNTENPGAMEGGVTIFFFITGRWRGRLKTFCYRPYFPIHDPLALGLFQKLPKNIMAPYSHVYIPSRAWPNLQGASGKETRGVWMKNGILHIKRVF